MDTFGKLLIVFLAGYGASALANYLYNRKRKRS
jgi:hypothetical protein